MASQRLPSADPTPRPVPPVAVPSVARPAADEAPPVTPGVRADPVPPPARPVHDDGPARGWSPTAWRRDGSA